MKVTVSQDTKKIVFSWNDACNECEYLNLGFEENEIDIIIATQGHEGKEIEGYEVSIEW